MIPNIYDLWDVKDIHAYILLDSEENHTYKRIGIEAMGSYIEHRQIAIE